MKLTIRKLKIERYPHYILAVCDADGVALPNQTAVTLKQSVGEATHIIVEFVVDGERVAMGA